jgi:uncharacterized membrane protein
VMNKDILAGILGDETEAFFVIEPLHFATCHMISLLSQRRNHREQTYITINRGCLYVFGISLVRYSGSRFRG